MKAKLFTYALMLAFVTGIVSCDNDDDPAPSDTITFHVHLDGASEVPPVTSTGSGDATFTYNKVTYMLEGTVTYTGITATNAHIHKGAAGVSGSVVIPFGPTFTSPIVVAPVLLDAAQRADLLANLYYVNLHTAAHSGGELRGQLVKP